MLGSKNLISCAWGKDNPALDQGHPTSRTVQQIPAEPSIHEFVIFDGAEPEDSDGTKARCRILLGSGLITRIGQWPRGRLQT